MSADLLEHLRAEVHDLRAEVSRVHSELVRHGAVEERYEETMRNLTRAVSRNADFNDRHHDELQRHIHRTELLENAMAPLDALLTDWHRARGALWVFAALGSTGAVAVIAERILRMF